MRPIRVVATMEAYTVTGPAKNLIGFASKARTPIGNQRAVDLSILTFARTSGSNQFIDAARNAGIAVDIVMEKSAYDRGVFAQIAQIVERRQPDIVQTHAIKAHFLQRLSRQRKQRPWIAFHHGYTAENLKMRLYNEINRFSLPAANKVVTVCNPFADLLANRGVKRSRIEVLPNSIEPFEPASQARVQQLRRDLAIEPGEQVLLTVGRFSSEKGQSDLIPMMAQLLRTSPSLPVRHILVGDGIAKHTIEQLATAAGVRDRFIFAGHHGDVRPFYYLADIYVLPSHSEGSPNVLLEAMSAGLPIVATSVGGVPETVRNEESALLVEPRKPEQLAAAVGRLLADQTLREQLRRVAAQDVVTCFSPEAYSQRMISIYERVCRERSATVT
jgi:glycosyltransferase involved in cell wall biosynthesis